ncbi:Non-specific phospholipase C3, partial [Cucurbita argyrosperma subsp. argyrosperma]
MSPAISATATGDGKSTASPIKTIVILVQENRSFDHMLGWMKSLNPEIDGVSNENRFSNPISTSDPNSPSIFFGNASAYVDPDPGHSIQDVHEQIFAEPWSDASQSKDPLPLATMRGFAQNAERIEKGMSATVMNGFKPEAVPVFKELVMEFGVCDRWFASVPASTQPNRLFVHSATSFGLSRNDTKQLIGGLPQKTIFESLEEEGFSFGIYYQHLPSTLFYRDRTEILRFSIITWKRRSSHDVSEGQKLIKEVYEALRSSPQWNQILFLITYDEHGGFFDHVPPPLVGVPNPDGRVGPPPYNFMFDCLGVRVPTVFVSPWIQPGTVLHRPLGPDPTSEFEHSSIPATVKKIFGLEQFLTKRDEWAATFEIVLNRHSPRTDCPVKLKDPVKLRDVEANETRRLSEFQEELVQLAAVLKGDEKKEINLEKVAEKMRVVEGASYCENALKSFLKECEKAMENGGDECEIVVCGENQQVLQPSSKSFARRFLACLACHG